MRLANLDVREIRRVYVDNIDQWVEIPVFDQEALIKLVNQISWEKLSLEDYKKTLVERWPGLSSIAKSRLKDNPIARDELYGQIVKENWGLAPGASIDRPLIVYTQDETSNVMLWFASNKAQGHAPEVL